VRSCAYGAPRIRPDLTGIGDIMGAAKIEPALCQGCGVCAAACPAGAIEMLHSTNEQIIAKIDALFEPVGCKTHQPEPAIVPLVIPIETVE
jgi:heterodisulfide reductase subunit A